MPQNLTLVEYMIGDLYRLLTDGGHSLVVENDGIHTFDSRGIADLYQLLQTSPDVLRGARVADKVVGKAAAALMILGGVEQLFAGIVSAAALSLLSEYGVAVKYEQAVPNIINRQKTGLCPMESCCLGCSTPAECLVEIEKLISKFNSKK